MDNVPNSVEENFPKSIDASFARQILGEDRYKELLLFFIELFEMFEKCEAEEKSYIALVITRRCHVLWEIFFSILRGWYSSMERPREWEEFGLTDARFVQWKRMYDTHVVTDTALSNMAHGYAQLFYESSADPTFQFPETIVVDELMIHGRALNGLLYSFEEEIRKQYERLLRPVETTAEELQQLSEKFAKCLSIRICVVNNEDGLLLRRYLSRLEPKIVADRHKWRECSMLYSQLVAESCVSNTAYSWSHYRREPFFALKQAECEPFRALHTSMHHTEQDCFIWIYPDEEHPKAVCTVRTKTGRNKELVQGASSKAQWQLFVPYTLFDHLDLQRIWALHQRILASVREQNCPECLERFITRYDEQIKDDVPSGDTVYYRWLCETNELFINALLMKRFRRVFSIHDQELSTDWGLLVRNYLSLEAVMDTSKNDVHDALESIQTWAKQVPEETLELYLDTLTQNLPALWAGRRMMENALPLHIPQTPLEWVPIIYGTENAIAEVGYEAERHAHILCSSQTTFSEKVLSGWGENHSLSTLLIKCREHLTPYLEHLGRDVDFCHVLAVIVHAMDYGLIGMNPVYKVPPNVENMLVRGSRLPEVYTGQRAGEGSMFILPMRYTRYISMLAGIMKKHDKSVRDVELDIYWYVWRQVKDGKVLPFTEYEPYELLAETLAWFYQMIVWCGQQFSDWTFPLMHWSERELDSVR